MFFGINTKHGSYDSYHSMIFCSVSYQRLRREVSNRSVKHPIRNAWTSWDLWVGLSEIRSSGNIVSCWRFCLHLCLSSGLCQQLFPYPFFARRSFISCLLVSKVPAGRAALSRHGGKSPFRSWKMNSVISMTPSSLSLILKSELL